MAQRLAGGSEYALVDASADGALVLLCRRCPPLSSYTSTNSHSYSSAGWPEPDYLLFDRSQNRCVLLATRVHVGSGSSHSPPAGVDQPLPRPLSADVPENEEEGPTTSAGAAAHTGRRALVRVAKLSASGRYLVCRAPQAHSIRTSCVHFSRM